jgi:Putative zinc-finger
MRDSTSTQTTSAPGPRPTGEDLAAYAAGPCPTDEELAAYIDGGLDPAESRRVAKHLASCADCFELYGETARFLVDSSPASPEDAAREAALAGKGVVRFPTLAERRRQVAQWVSIAALLVVGAGGGGYFQFLSAPPPLTTIADKVPSQAALIPSLWKGPTYRGAPETEAGKLNEESFRMGVHLVNLSTTVRAGNAREAEDEIARILQILAKESFTDPLQNGYKGITAALENGKPPQSLLPEVDRLAGRKGDADSVREVFDPLSLDLGQWVEAGRLSTVAKDPSFFQDDDNRQFLAHLIRRDKLGLGETKMDPATLATLAQIRDAFPSGNVQPSDYVRLRPLFDDILKRQYPET